MFVQPVDFRYIDSVVSLAIAVRSFILRAGFGCLAICPADVGCWRVLRYGQSVIALASVAGSELRLVGAFLGDIAVGSACEVILRSS